MPAHKDRPSGKHPLTDHEFIAAFEKIGGKALAEKLGVRQTTVLHHRKRVEERLRRQIISPTTANGGKAVRVGAQHPGRLLHDVPDGIVLIGSDAHYWPGEPSTMHRAFVWGCKEFSPKLVIMNGDVVDMAAVSRHPPIGWENQPTVQEEIETAQDRLDEICRAIPQRCRKIWTLGNHDGRFETRLATVAPEYARMNGVHLRDHFPLWEPCWSVWINDDVVVKHRFKGGLHATHNNAVTAGKTMVTGHLHSAKVTPWTDYNGTRWGVDTGCIADPAHRAFLDYTEDNPKNWRGGFGVFTFYKGELLQPELVLQHGERTVQFRGKIIQV